MWVRFSFQIALNVASADLDQLTRAARKRGRRATRTGRADFDRSKRRARRALNRLGSVLA